MPLDINPPGGGGTGTPYASTPANVTTAGAAGASSDYARGDHAHRGVASVAKDGSAALYGAVTFSEGSNVTLTQVGQDIEIAASGGGGPPAAITWDTANVTNSATGTYQTWAEIRTQANSTTAPLAVLVKGTPTTSGTTTDSWPHVTFKSDDAALTLTFTEGVVVKDARFDMAGIVTSTATTTTNLQYAPGAKVNLRGQFSAGTVGLLGVDGDGTVEFRLSDGSLLSTYAFHSDAGDTLNVYTGATEWEAGAVDHFEGSAGTVNVYYTNETIGLPEVSAYTGTYTDTLRPYLAATRPTPPASAVVVLRLDDVAGTTSVANSGTGTAFTLGTITGTMVFGSPTPIGNGMFVLNTSYIRGAGAALTYQATTQNMTALCWVKFAKGTTLGGAGDKATLFGKESTAGATFAITVLQDTGKLSCAIDTATGGPTLTEGGFVDTGWSLLGMTYDGTTVKIYINGVSVGSGVANTGNMVWDNTKSWQVGNSEDNALYILRECWFHNAVLTLEEIQSIYNTGAFNGAIGVLDAQSLNGVDIDPTLPVAGETLIATAGVSGVWSRPSDYWRVSDFVEADPAHTTVAADITAGHQFMVTRDCYCDGIRFYHASASGTPNVTLELWDAGGAVLATATQAVTTTPTMYEVMFGTPIDLTAEKGTLLVVSGWQTTGSSYFKASLSNPFGSNPVAAGLGLISYGNIYEAAHAFPTTATGIGLGFDPILRLKLCL